MDKNEKLKLGVFCRKFRIEDLKMGLTEFSIKNSDVPQNISAFEGGKANNIKYLGYYYNLCTTGEQRSKFKRGVFK